MILRLVILLLMVGCASSQNITNLFTGQQLYTGMQLTSVASSGGAGPSYTGPTWVTNGVFTSGAAAVTPALPTGYAANDIFILFVESENGASSEIGPPSGWSVVTNLSGVTNGLGALNGASSTSLETFWKRATASESAPSVADRGDYALAQIMAIRGAESNAYPFHQVHVMNKPGSSQTVSITNATTTISDCLIVLATTAMFDGSTGDNYSDWYNPSLTNLTERGDVGTITASGGAMANLTGEQWTEGTYLVTTGLVDTTTVSIDLTAAVMPVQPRAAMIVTDPVAQSVQTNANATFTVVASGGTAVPLTYRWQTNSVDVANSAGRWGGSATTSLTLTNCLLTDSNTLVRCIITNSLGSVTSAVVALTVSEVPNYEFVETFDATGYDNSGWTTTQGTINADNTTNVLSGTQSLACSLNSFIQRSVSAGSPRYFHMQAKLLSGGYNYFLYSTDGPRIMLNDPAGAALTWYHGSVSASGTATVATNTLYHIWFDWTAGPNGTLHGYVSTTSTKPATPDVTITTGDGAAIGTYYLGPEGAAIGGIFDRVIIHTNDISSNP